jgi:hypothetical protein
MAITETYTTKSGETFKIEYEERGNAWRAEMEGEYITAPSLRELKEKLDKKTSPKVKSRRVPCLVRSGHATTLSPAHATSIDDRHYQIRVTYEKGGTREQVNRHAVYANNERNRALAVEIADVHGQQQALHSKMLALSTKLEAFDIDQLKDD